MKKIAGLKEVYKMLGKEAENKTYLLGWVWVHRKMARTASS
jgi:hypothetical protein